MKAEKKVDVRGSFRVMSVTPGHVTYGVWVNGGKCGNLVVRREEAAAVEAMLMRGGFVVSWRADIDR